ncbi:PAS domain-containing hybrid sensor histidine kinase/response regulator [Pseudorhodoferax soli]|uniref:histidine kinase n=1 Tax=Pseudorhodoferax soli TaxID=545864 RepID=A0A368Y107_9BURK|nr:response regulator [Pseudorhodoferax soli]RCW72487.1 PAS domain-containing protein [Pseudorhodoferax soli]
MSAVRSPAAPHGPAARPRARLRGLVPRWPAPSLRSYFVAVILLTSVPIALVLVWRVGSEAAQTRARMDAGLQAGAQALAQHADRELRASFDALAALADALALREGAPRVPLLRARQRMQPAWASVFLADEQGNVLADTADMASAAAAAPLPALLRRAAAGGGPARLVARTPSGQVLLALPLYEGGQLRQWLGVRFEPRFWPALVAAAPAEVALPGLLTRAGEPIAGAAPQALPPQERPPAGMQRLPLADGRAALVAARALREADWFATSAALAEPLEQAERERMLQTVATTGASLLLGVSLALLLALQVTRPLGALAARGQAPRPGPLPMREIALLAEALAAARRADRAAADQLQRRADEFEALFHGSPIGLAFARDAACASVQCNPAMDALLGAAAPPAGSLGVFQTGRRLEPGQQPLQRACRTGQPVPATELELRRAGQPVLHVVASAVPLHDADGRARGALSAVMDVTPLKTALADLERAHRALQAKQALVELAQDAGQAGVLEFRFRADELLCSAGMSRLLGLAPMPLHGRLRDWLAAVAPEDRPALRAQLAAALARRRPRVQLDFRVAGSTGRWLSLRLACLYLDDGRPLQMVGMAVDATGLKRAERRHRRVAVHEHAARREAQAESRAKDEFLLMLGHELRNPLGAIAGAAEVLHSGAGGPQLARRAVAIVQRQTQRLTELLDRLLDSAHAADGGTAPVRRQPGDQASAAPRDTAPRRVLLVDDHADLREATGALLAHAGHTVLSAGDGAAGLALLLAEWPDAAVVDIGMPGMDGLTLARRARAAGYPGRLVAISGYGRPRALEAARQAGFDAYVVKPVSGEALRRAMDPRSEGFPD